MDDEHALSPSALAVSSAGRDGYCSGHLGCTSGKGLRELVLATPEPEDEARQRSRTNALHSREMRALRLSPARNNRFGWDRRRTGKRIVFTDGASPRTASSPNLEASRTTRDAPAGAEIRDSRLVAKDRACFQPSLREHRAAPRTGSAFAAAPASVWMSAGPDDRHGPENRSDAFPLVRR
jgi:hypothetical protein